MLCREYSLGLKWLRTGMFTATLETSRHRLLEEEGKLCTCGGEGHAVPLAQRFVANKERLQEGDDDHHAGHEPNSLQSLISL